MTGVQTCALPICRRPNIYGLNPDSGYFIGVDIKHFRINLALINFKGDLMQTKCDIPFQYENSEANLESLCDSIDDFINSLNIERKKIFSVGINISGRVNSETGHSYSRYFFSEKPLSEIFQERLGIHVSIDNDSRAMAYGEYLKGVVHGEKKIGRASCRVRV